MRLLIDRPVRKSIAELLREHLHHDVADCYGSDYENFSDEEIMARATEENRIVVTSDKGFRRRGRFPICTHPGILIPHNKRTEDQEAALLRLTSSRNQAMVEHAITRMYVDKMEVESERGLILLSGDQFETIRQPANFRQQTTRTIPN